MISVDTKDILKLSDKLMSAHRAVFPNAVRFTLNDLAFDVKKITLMPALKSSMIIRSENFFRKYSGVEKATGWDIESMQSQVGMIPSGSATKAVSRLEQQEEGGSLDRPYVPMEHARYGNTPRGRIRRQGYLGNIFLWRRIQAGNKQGFIKAVTSSGVNSGGTGKGIVVMYGSLLYEIVGFHRDRNLNKIYLNVNKLYNYERGRNVNIRPHRFMERSAMQTGPKMQDIFSQNLEKQLKKFAGR